MAELWQSVHLTGVMTVGKPDGIGRSGHWGVMGKSIAGTRGLIIEVDGGVSG